MYTSASHTLLVGMGEEAAIAVLHGTKGEPNPQFNEAIVIHCEKPLDLWKERDEALDKVLGLTKTSISK